MHGGKVGSNVALQQDIYFLPLIEPNSFHKFKKAYYQFLLALNNKL